MRRRRLQILLLTLWALASFGVMLFADEAQQRFFDWPLNYWLAAQGSVLIFIGIVVVWAWARNRALPRMALALDSDYQRRIGRRFGGYILGLLGFVALLGWAEQRGLGRTWIGVLFMLATVLVYASIGIYARTSNAFEYFVAGRRVPALYNGMATAADWMSAASFISMAGGLYLQGFMGVDGQAGGLVYIVGWTGGFCLLALLVAPQLRRLDLYTVPDYFQRRFGGQWPRRMAALAAILCSFTYLVAQIYGVGLIASRLTGVQFEMGILLGLGGVLVCSFLGGMRAVTWTQVAQYVVLILAFLVPVTWLAVKQQGSAWAVLDYSAAVQRVSELEQRLRDDPREQEVQHEYLKRAGLDAERLRDVPAALERERKLLRERVAALKASHADEAQVVAARRALNALPPDVAAARERWTRSMQENLERARPLGGLPPHARSHVAPASGGDATQPQEAAQQLLQRNVLALLFCLMVGTAGMPHLLTRYYTVPSEAQARTSVAWSLGFIALLYLAAPALAVLVKLEIMQHLVGLRFDALPGWIAQWSQLDPSLIRVQDVNGDGVLQFGELRIGADLVMLATPELGAMPFVVSGLVAAGGMAAALSTADGLLLTLGNALAHDLLVQRSQTVMGEVRRVMLSKFALLIVALAAAYLAAQRPADILALVASSFSLAAAALVPTMLGGIFWSRTHGRAAVLAMGAGLLTTVGYMAWTSPTVRRAMGWAGDGLWWGIQPVASGVFGAAAGVSALVLAALILRPESGIAEPHAGPRTEDSLGL